MEITKDSIIGEILDYDQSTAKIFIEMGMHCLGCPSARAESIGEACQAHGIDPEKLVEKLNHELQK